MASVSWPVGLVLAVVITAALVGLWWLGSSLFRTWAQAIRAKKSEATPLRIGSIQVFGSGWQQALLGLGNRTGLFVWRLLLVLAWPLLVALALPFGPAWLEVLRAFFVLTARAMGDSFVSFLPNLGRIVLIVVVFRFLLAALRWTFEEIRKGRIRLGTFDRSWARQTYGLIRIAVIILVAILVFPLLPGSGSTGFQGIAIFVGALVSLGASSAIANAVAGIVLTYTKAFNAGDRVQIHATTGDIIDRALFVTRIRTIKNEEIAIPNQLVLAGPIINYSQDAGGNGVAVEVKIGLGYDVPWKDAHRLLKESAVQEGVLKEPAARVYQEELGDFAVSYTLHAFVGDPKTMLSIRSHIIADVMDRFAKAGIEITSPEHLALRNAGPTAPKEAMTLSVEAAAPPEPKSTVKSDVPVDKTAAKKPKPEDLPIGKPVPDETANPLPEPDGDDAAAAAGGSR